MRSQIFWQNFFHFLGEWLDESEKEKIFQKWKHKGLEQNVIVEE